MGHGDPAKAHSVILRDFLESLLRPDARPRRRLDTVKAPVLPSTLRLIDRRARRCSAAPIRRRSAAPCSLRVSTPIRSWVAALYEGRAQLPPPLRIRRVPRACVSSSTCT
ncbi:hypothetical protein ACRAWF_07405 [Streptomyces sp. L7]